MCTFQWVINALDQTPYITRLEAGQVIGVPECVNETYGLMSADCLVTAFSHFGLDAFQRWVTFDQAYAIAGAHTGAINPVGMYHVMGVRGVDDGAIWVANSAPGYAGVYELLQRDQFDRLGPVQMIYLPESRPSV